MIVIIKIVKISLKVEDVNCLEIAIVTMSYVAESALVSIVGVIIMMNVILF